MQSLRAHSYHCVSSLSATTKAILQRPITSPTHWRLRYKHLTTLFYSTLITSAAVADANIKGKRRRHWDNAIADAERSLHSAAPREAPQTRWARQDNDLDSTDEYNFDFNFAVDPPSLEEREQQVRQEYQNASDHDIDGQQLKALSEEVLFDLAQQRPIPVLSTRVSPHSMYASDFRRTREVGGAQPKWTPKKQVSMELAMARLATTLLIWTKENPEYNPQLEKMGILDVKQLKKRQRDIASEVARLHEMGAYDLGDIQRLEHPQYSLDRENSLEETRQLNAALMTLLRKHALQKMSLQDTMAKIVYNLMISPAPPDVQTFSILINRLSRLGYHEPANAVIHTVLSSHQRVNECLLNDMLAHFVRSENPYGFQRLLERSQGEGKGLNLAHPDIRIGVGQHRLTQKGDHILQHIELDQVLYRVIISGSLQFGNLKQATSMYKRMRDAGYQGNVQLLTHFLRYFGTRSDWPRGIAVWHSIKGLLNLQGRRFREKYVRRERMAFHEALQLCEKCGSDSHWNAIYNEAQARGHTDESLTTAPVFEYEFHGKHDAQVSWQRKMRVVQRRGEILLHDIKVWAMQVLAARILLSGAPFEDIKAAFLRHADVPNWEDWLSRRMQPGIWHRSIKLERGQATAAEEMQAGSDAAGHGLSENQQRDECALPSSGASDGESIDDNHDTTGILDNSLADVEHETVSSFATVERASRAALPSGVQPHGTFATAWTQHREELSATA